MPPIIAHTTNWLISSAARKLDAVNRTHAVVNAIRAGETGYVVSGRSPAEVTGRLVHLLTDIAGARAMGEKGMAWIDQEWRWDLVAQRLQQILAGRYT